MANTYLGHMPASNPKSVQSEYSFPEDCYVLRYQFSTSDRQAADKVILDIWYAGAPSTSFNNAPVSSRLNDTTNGDVYIKTGTGSSWTKASP